MKKLSELLKERANKALKIFEKFRSRHEHEENIFEFDIKIEFIEIPEWVYDKLSEREVDELFWFELEDRLNDFVNELKEKYDWIGRVWTAGRMGGWLNIEDKNYSRETVQNFLAGGYDSDDEEERRYYIKLFEKAERVANDLLKIANDIDEAKAYFEDTLSSDGYWENIID